MHLTFLYLPQVDHAGVPNTRLIEENPKLATFYNNTSIAEQNSVDLAWDL